MSSDDPEMLTEVVEAPADDVDASSEEPEVSADGPQVLSEDPKASSEGIKSLSEDPEVSADDVDASSDGPEALTEDVKVLPEDPEVSANGPQVEFDDPEASPDDVKVSSEEGLVVPFAQFVGLYDVGPPHPAPPPDILNNGFLWIEGSCVYLRDTFPIPLDIQAVAELDLDLVKVAHDIARWNENDSTVEPFMYKSEPAHRLLLRLPRYETRYDPDTEQLRTGILGTPLKSGDHVAFGPVSRRPLSDEFRASGCDARGQIEIVTLWSYLEYLDLQDLSELYSYNGWLK